jgi:hypothetical protein
MDNEEEATVGKRFGFNRKEDAAPSSKQEEPAPKRTSEGRAQQTPAAREAQTTTTSSAERPRPGAERIAVRAYEIWESHGRPSGTDRENWFEAERQLRAEAR